MALVRSASPIGLVLQIRNYRLLAVGQGLALLGEQINLVALSWLALQLTGNAAALGSVLAVAGTPPALLMLASGVITDRFSARTILLAADALRLVLVCALMALILLAEFSLPILYVVALAFGLLTALAMPSAGSIVPALVPRTALQPANALYQGLAQLAGFVGPALAGLLIAANGATRTVVDAGQGQPGTGETLAVVPAFALYAAGLAVSVITLWSMRIRRDRPVPAPEQAQRRVWAAFAVGWRYAWEDPLLRLLLPAILAANLLLAGPLAVGIPVLARLRMVEGAAAFGLIAAGWGGGNLLGTFAAGARWQARRLGLLVCALFIVFGAGLIAMSRIGSPWPGFLILFVMGAGNGYLGVILRTLIHQRTPAELLGRVMSVFFFARTLLVPLSQTASGAAADANPEALFIGAGALFAVLAAWFALSPAPRLFEQAVKRECEGRPPVTQAPTA